MQPGVFAADLSELLAGCATSGLAAPPTPSPDGSLPSFWELQQAALWSAAVPACQIGALAACLKGWHEAAAAATRAALSKHLHASVEALLRGDRALSADGAAPQRAEAEPKPAQPVHARTRSAGAALGAFSSNTDSDGKGSRAVNGTKPTIQRAGGLPPANAPMEELLRWLRPSAFVALLESVSVLLRTLQWFYSGCGALLEAALLSAQAPAADSAAVQRMAAAVQQAVADAVQARWAKLVTAMYGRELDAYARGVQADPPVSLRGFGEVLGLAGQVERACAAAHKPAAALRQALRSLGRDLLTVRPAWLPAKM